MCSEQWGKIPVAMVGLKNPIGDLLGRGGKKTGGVKMQRIWGCADLRAYEENLHTETPRQRRDIEGGSSEWKELIQGNDAFLHTD